LSFSLLLLQSVILFQPLALLHVRCLIPAVG
jgi:hypothetical protein